MWRMNGKEGHGVCMGFVWGALPLAPFSLATTAQLGITFSLRICINFES